MTRPNISPGKWKIKDIGTELDAPNHTLAIEGDSGFPGLRCIVARCCGWNMDNQPSNCHQANAQAIAALPKLLAALESALSLLEAANDHQRAAGRLEYDTNTVRAALLAAGYTE